jgi:hypothetical protein
VHSFVNWGLAFEGGKRSQCASYNGAIRSVSEERGWEVFHQSGGSNEGQDVPGRHYWEFWTKQADEKVLKEAIPEIHERAARDYELFGYQALDDE